jgi:hypothetical protein
VLETVLDVDEAAEFAVDCAMPGPPSNRPESAQASMGKPTNRRNIRAVRTGAARLEPVGSIADNPWQKCAT